MNIAKTGTYVLAGLFATPRSVVEFCFWPIGVLEALRLLPATILSGIESRGHVEAILECEGAEDIP